MFHVTALQVANCNFFGFLNISVQDVGGFRFLFVEQPLAGS